MPYDKEKLFNKAKKVIKKESIFFIEDLAAFMPCTKSTLYNLFPIDLPEMDELKGMIADNRITIKQGLKNKWYDSENPTMHLALYKLIGTSDERKKLSQTHHDLTTAGEKIQPVTLDEETIKKLVDKI